MSNTQSLSALIGDAGLDNQASQAMLQVIDDVGPVIQAGLGEVTIDDIATSEVILVSLLIDDSSSIRFVAGNMQAVRDGHNLVLDALGGPSPRRPC